MAGIETRIRKKERQIKKAFGESVREIAMEILEEAKRRVPVDTGYLKSTGQIEKVSHDEYKVVFEADYAIYVHERIELQHANGEARFLSNAVEAVVRRDVVADRVREKLNL